MTKSPVSTYALLAVNLIAFGWLALQQQSLMMNSTADVLAILHAGANLNPFTLGGQPWRIVTSMFLHFGIIHLAVNMYALFSLGSTLEPALGTVRFVLVYFFCGIAAGLASLVFNIYTPSAGASGALFGLFGYRLGAEIIGNFHDRQKLMNVFLNFIVFVVINAFIATTVNVDMAGHIGGFIAGLVLATFHFKLRWFIPKKYLALLVLLLASTLFVLPKDQLHYYNLFQRVLKVEDHTNELYKKIKTDGELKDSLAAVLPVWDSIATSLNAIDKIPIQLSSDTATLREYINLSRNKTFYLVKQIERESYIYYDSIEILNAKFQALPKLKYILNFEISETQDEPTDSVSEDTGAPARVYYDSHWKETNDIASASYYRVGLKDSLGRWHGSVYDYFKNGDIQMKGKYEKDKKNGIFIYYSDRKTYESAGRYENEYAVGKWENFHWNGALESEVFYGNQTFTANVFDSLGNVQVINGDGKVKRWYANGQLLEEGEYRDGRKDGMWFGFHADGKPYYKEQFRDNRLVHGVSQGTDGRRYVYDHLSEYPFPVAGMTEFKKYIDQHRHNIVCAHGKVKVIFTVGTDGTTWNYVVIQSVSPACDAEAIRLVKEGPAWRPAVLHGQEKITSQGYIEIEF